MTTCTHWNACVQHDTRVAEREHATPSLQWESTRRNRSPVGRPGQRRHHGASSWLGRKSGGKAKDKHVKVKVQKQSDMTQVTR
jgi:hypothetical protein